MEVVWFPLNVRDINPQTRITKALKFLGVEVSHKTVYLWIRKYVGLMEKYLDKRHLTEEPQQKPLESKSMVKTSG